MECEVYCNDLHSSIEIDVYSNMLLSLNEWDEQKEFIKDIEHLYELRGVWWENIEYNNDDISIEDFVEKEFDRIASKWYLNYVTD